MGNRYARFTTAIGAVGMTVLLAGCSVFSGDATTARQWPKPAVSQGMKLVWGPDVKKMALQLISQSHHDIDLDMYELSDPDVLAALSAAAQRHVNVRVVLDATESHSLSVGYPKLQSMGIPVKLIHIKQGIDHVKMLIADQRVLIGGMNYGSASWHNNDASVFIPHVNPSFASMFNWDMSRASGWPSVAPSLELPLIADANIGQTVLTAIQSARQSIDMEAFDLSDRAVVNGLHSALRRGVQVTILVDPTQYYNAKPVSLLRGAGALVRYYRPYESELMHAKILDVDHGATFIIGSANFSHQAYTYNHEADLVLHDVLPFDVALRQNLAHEEARGSDYPAREKTKIWA